MFPVACLGLRAGSAIVEWAFCARKIFWGCHDPFSSRDVVLTAHATIIVYDVV